jgi:osmoprotectant transport system substrate-binding protein
MRRPSLAAALAAAVLMAGCGATPSPDGADTHTTAPSAATTLSNLQPPNETATTAVVLPGTGKPTILLGDMNTPEQFVLGALYQEALLAQGYSVSLTRNIGTTSVSQSALHQNSLNIYPQYLNVFLQRVVGTHRRFRSLDSAFAAAQRYAGHHGMTLLSPTPFSDTAGIAVTAGFASHYHLSSLSDLHRVDGVFVLGSPLEYSISKDGLPALERAYGFKPALTTDIDIGSQYGAMRDGSIDGAYVQTTDGALSSDKYVTLADPERFYGYGNVIPVVSKKVIAAEGPDFVATINRVDSLLTPSAMRGLDAEMGVSQLDPQAIAGEVARDFLQAYGLVQLPGWATSTLTTPTPGSTAPAVTAPVVTAPDVTTPITGTSTAPASSGAG